MKYNFSLELWNHDVKGALNIGCVLVEYNTTLDTQLFSQLFSGLRFGLTFCSKSQKLRQP